MKRLIKNRYASVIEADAPRLVDGKIDPNAAIALIQSKDPYFKEGCLIGDKAAGCKAYWGAISDDGLYSCEAYMYKGAKGLRKCALVCSPKDNSSVLECIIKNIDSATDIRSIVRAGFTLPSGVKVKFANEYTSFADAPQVSDADGNIQVASKK